MKQLFATILLLHSITVIKAQDRFEEIKHYKFFKVQADMGYARPAGSGVKAGVLLALEPKINLSDRVSIGLRSKATAMIRGGYSINNISAEGEAGLGIAILPTVDYYFTNRLVRPFVGAGAGAYNFVSIEATTEGGGRASVPAVTKFGAMLRAGVEIWHVRAGFHYNLAGKKDNVNYNYYGVTIGLVFGGGVKEEYRGNDY
jgi:hypothetical protein